MKVKELILALQEMPQETEVFVFRRRGLDPIMKVENIDVPYVSEDGQEMDCLETILLTYTDLTEEEDDEEDYDDEDEDDEKETNQYNVN